METKAEVVICGAGIAGVATAYHLAVHHGLRDVVLVDERPPLTLTSDKSTECYRNWWPSQAMTGLMNRSIDWLERLADESDNYFHLNRRGYVYLTANPATAVSWHHYYTKQINRFVHLSYFEVQSSRLHLFLFTSLTY